MCSTLQSLWVPKPSTEIRVLLDRKCWKWISVTLKWKTFQLNLGFIQARNLGKYIDFSEISKYQRYIKSKKTRAKCLIVIIFLSKLVFGIVFGTCQAMPVFIKIILIVIRSNISSFLVCIRVLVSYLRNLLANFGL